MEIGAEKVVTAGAMVTRKDAVAATQWSKGAIDFLAACFMVQLAA